MSAYAPAAIKQLFADIQRGVPSAVLSGIVGDQYHSFGYHLARNDLPSTDYSVVLPKDKLGDGGAASALDVSLGPQLMITCTSRLLAAARAHDPRLAALREFCGTTDGVNTHPYDLSDGQDGPLNSWDSSHLSHIHLSFYREYENDYTALAPIAAVFTGSGAAPAANSITLLEEDPMKDFVGRDGTGQYWLIAHDFSHRVALTPSAAKGLVSTGRYSGLPSGFDQTTLGRIPVAK